MKYRIRWTVSGESVVREAEDAEQAQAVAEHAVGRASRPATLDGTEIDVERFHYARESTGVEDG